MLSRKSIDQLTQKIEDEVANYVTEDPRFTELLNELVPEAIDITLGNIDDRSAVNLVLIYQVNYVVVQIIHKYIIHVALYDYFFLNSFNTLYTRYIILF